MPRGLGTEGQKLWTGVIGEFNLAYEPHKIRILTDACKTADLIKRLDDAAANYCPGYRPRPRGAALSL